MILDHLARVATYEKLHPRFAACFAFLRRTDLPTLAQGRHAIDDERAFALVQEYDTKPWAEGSLEVHRRYIDIQFVVAGEESIGFAPLTAQAVRESYDEAKDIAFLEGTGEPFTLRAGHFAIFFPNDAHMPGRTTGEPTRVRKIVIKVEVGSASWIVPPSPQHLRRITV